MQAAARIGTYARQFGRIFRKATVRRSRHYYRAMRMNTARQLVLIFGVSITSIALAAGHVLAVLKIENYREVLGLYPAQHREQINLFRVR